MKILFLFLLALFASTTSWARPVSYAEGWTLMQRNDGTSNSIHLHYSPTAKYSIGYKAEYFRDKQWQFHGSQINYLAKRWNKKNSQANIYLKGAAGIAHSDFGSFNSKVETAGFVGIAADWETRRYFTSYENRHISAGEIDRFFTQSARIGIAPYIGDYGDLHTWLMLQVEHNPQQSNNYTVTPIVRLFKNEYLTEVGISNAGKVLFNWFVRF